MNDERHLPRVLTRAEIEEYQWAVRKADEAYRLRIKLDYTNAIDWVRANINNQFVD